MGHIVEKIKGKCEAEFGVTPEVSIDEFQVTVYLKLHGKTFGVRVEFRPDCIDEVCELIIQQIIDAFRNRIREMENG